MSKFKKGQKVWAYRQNGFYPICEELRYNSTSEDVPTQLILYNGHNWSFHDEQHVFPTKQECIDYIINSIKVIPYE